MASGVPWTFKHILCRRTFSEKLDSRGSRALRVACAVAVEGGVQGLLILRTGKLGRASKAPGTRCAGTTAHLPGTTINSLADLLSPGPITTHLSLSALVTPWNRADHSMSPIAPACQIHPPILFFIRRQGYTSLHFQFISPEPKPHTLCPSSARNLGDKLGE